MKKQNKNVYKHLFIQYNIIIEVIKIKMNAQLIEVRYEDENIWL